MCSGVLSNDEHLYRPRPSTGQGQTRRSGMFLIFLGFELDSTAMTICLLCQKTRQTAVPHTDLDWKEIVYEGRTRVPHGVTCACQQGCASRDTFTRRLFQLLAATRQAHHHIRLNLSFWPDLLWWENIMHDRNGVAIMQENVLGRLLAKCGQIIWDARGVV